MCAYVQKNYNIDILRMKVDFHKDEFDQIWMMQANNILVRHHRMVPSETGHMLADYVLSEMVKYKLEEEQRKR